MESPSLLRRQQTLAVPKIFCGIRLEYFDRGAKPCSLLRPLGALRKLCSFKGTKRTALTKAILNPDRCRSESATVFSIVLSPGFILY